ncbi:flagellin [Nibricoccus sp. IMCC34717]|uniref:flagellin n=1 Tax=Nibricoccus sp. IMCC34717 TaxID=3034021 RepID=UPI00384E042F
MSSDSVKILLQENAAFVGRVRDLQGRALNRLGTGNQAATPSDNPTGTGLIEKMTAQNRRIEAAKINVQNATSLTQSMDGFLQGMAKLITRMSELAQAARDPSKNAADNALYRTEFRSLQDQLRTTVGGTVAEIGGTQGIADPLGKFNGIALFNAKPGGTIVLVGKNSTDQLVIPETNLRTGSFLSMIQQDASGNFLFDIADPTANTVLAAALDQVTDSESTVGSTRAGLDLVSGRLIKESEGLESSVSKIRDVDIAKESSRLAKFNMLTQTSTAMLSQASAAPKEILQLLRG